MVADGVANPQRQPTNAKNRAIVVPHGYLGSLAAAALLGLMAPLVVFLLRPRWRKFSWCGFPS